MNVERRPFSGRCQAEVKSKGFRRFKDGPSTKDFRCRAITDIVQDGQWRCGFHLGNTPAFAVKGVFVGDEDEVAS